MGETLPMVGSDQKGKKVEKTATANAIEIPVITHDNGEAVEVVFDIVGILS